MDRRPLAITLLVLLAGCSKGLVGDYTGTLTETCSIARTTDVKAGPGGQLTGNVTRCGGGGTTDRYALHVAKGAGKDKLEIQIKSCKIVLTANERTATVDPGQSCTLDVVGYKGKTTVNGSMAPMTDHERLQLSIDFVATDPGASGAYVVTFQGPRAK